jgi:redox-sensitive bicupin YhaK (pirin superfamily)
MDIGGKPVVELAVGPRLRPLGVLSVNRVWPTPRRRLIGPFVFFDHLQPTSLPPGLGLDVPPHPHIGLATVTYLFAGELLHRDSLGFRQAIRPREVNWMTAGRGIVHSERTPDEQRAHGGALHGTQTWVALPRAAEDCAPNFAHYPAHVLPEVELAGVQLRVIAGAAFGARSPVATLSDLFYVEAQMRSGARLTLDPELGERAVYVVEGIVAIAGQPYSGNRIAVLRDAIPVEVVAVQPCRLMLGGAPLEGQRFIWWNFVASSTERIEAAKDDWRRRRFAAVPGETEFMPLPPG